VQKKNEERKECEKKKKKRKEVRRDQDIKGCGKQIFKSASRSIVKRSWMKLGEIIEDYKMFLFSKFQKKMICFVRV
jgi:hypothetical protein